MTMSDRGVHPDLVDEEAAATSPEPEDRPQGGRRRSARRPAETPAPLPDAGGADGAADGGTPSAASSEPPEWLSSVREASSPEEMLNVLAKNLPKEVLEKNDTLRGWIGNVSQRRAEALRQQEIKDAQERAKLDAASRGDYYALGELSAPEVQRQLQAERDQQVVQPFMEQVKAFQTTLPPEVQTQIQGKTYGSFAEYIQATVEAAAQHSRETYFDQQLKEREPALRKAWLSQANGREQVPELDGGQATGVREITDEQLSRMSIEEGDQYLDEKGQPRPGVRIRLTRGIDVSRR